MRRLVILPVFTVIMLLAGCAPSSFNVSGDLDLIAGAYLQPDPGASGCIAASGYDDIAVGVQVVVTDSAGKTVGVGNLGSGKMTKDLSGCAFPFHISNVTPGSKFYKVTISHRGGIEYTEKQLKSGVSLSLGQ